jgi:hypothetical protein
VGIIDKLLQSIIDSAGEGHTSISAERNEFRRLLLVDLRKYSVLVEEVRQRFLNILDQLESSDGTVVPLPSTGISLVGALDLEYKDTFDGASLPLPREIAEILERNPLPRPPTTIGQSVLERTVDHLAELDAAWASIRPRLDEVFEAQAVGYLRVFRHDFRRLTQDAVVVVRRFHDDDQEIDLGLVRAYVEAVLYSADFWNSHIGGAIRDIRKGRAI